MAHYLHIDLRQAIAARQAVVVVDIGVSRIATNNTEAASDGLLNLGIQRCFDPDKVDAAWSELWERWSCPAPRRGRVRWIAAKE